VLHLRENEAYLRITVARAARENPVLLEMLRDGRLHLSGIARLAPHLTPQNAQAVLKRACGMSHREIRELVCELEPRPDVVTSVRKLPQRPASGSESGPLHQHHAPGVEAAAVPAFAGPLQLGAPRVEPDAVNLEPNAMSLESRIAAPTGPPVVSPARPAVVEPLAPARYQVRFTASAGLREKLERLQALMRSSVPDGDLARLIEIAVTEKLQRVEAKRFGSTTTPRRDSPANLALMCRALNTLVAEQDYGEDVMTRFRAATSRASVPVDAYGARIAVKPRWLSSG
jgi:hypothetical protein